MGYLHGWRQSRFFSRSLDLVSIAALAQALIALGSPTAQACSAATQAVTLCFGYSPSAHAAHPCLVTFLLFIINPIKQSLTLLFRRVIFGNIRQRCPGCLFRLVRVLNQPSNKKGVCYCGMHFPMFRLRIDHSSTISARYALSLYKTLSLSLLLFVLSYL